MMLRRSFFVWALVLAAMPQPSFAFDKSQPYGGQFNSICGPDRGDRKNWVRTPNAQEIALIGELMGSKSHRIWHAFWHQLRYGWGSESAETQFILERSAKIMAGLDPRTTTRAQLQFDPAEPTRITGFRDDPNFTRTGKNWKPNGARNGIDFLYMHHVMIEHTFAALKARGLRCIKPWGSMLGDGVGDPGDPEGPAGQAGIEQLQTLAKGYLEESYLKSQADLGRFGDEIEGSLHGGMHMRYGKNVPGFDNCRVGDAVIGRSQAELDREILNELAEEAQYPPAEQRPFVMIKASRAESDRMATEAYQRWKSGNCESPENNSLYKTSTSHVHWVFYKLHGLVEGLMLEWMRVHGYDGAQMPDGSCPLGGKCYRFLGGERPPWQGGTPPKSSGGSLKHADASGGHSHGDIAAAFGSAFGMEVKEEARVFAETLALQQIQQMNFALFKADPDLKGVSTQVASSDAGAVQAVYRAAAKVKAAKNQMIQKLARNKAFEKLAKKIRDRFNGWNLNEDFVSLCGSGKQACK